MSEDVGRIKSNKRKRICSVGRCMLCGAKIKPSNLYIDHIIPQAVAKYAGFNGDVNEYCNLAPVCYDCNMHKAANVWSLDDIKEKYKLLWETDMSDTVTFEIGDIKSFEKLYNKNRENIKKYNEMLKNSWDKQGRRCVCCGKMIHNIGDAELRRKDNTKPRDPDNLCVVYVKCAEKFNYKRKRIFG